MYIGSALREAGHQVVQIGINYRDQGHHYPWNIIPTSDEDPLGNDLLVSLLSIKGDDYSFDLVVAFNDLWICQRWFSIIDSVVVNHQIARPKFCGYFPIDAAGIPEELTRWLPYWNGVCTYTNWGAEQLRRSGFNGFVTIIPHGVDIVMSADPTESFCLPEFAEAAWIVLRTDINRPRKRYDLTIQAFCEFAKDKPLPQRGGPLLWLHCAPMGDDLDVARYYDRIMLQMGCDPNQRPLMTTQTGDPSNVHPYVSDSVLSDIYRTASVYLQTSDAEGWGLCAVEAAKHGCLVVAGRHSVHEELWQDCAILVDPVGQRAETFGLYRVTPHGVIPVRVSVDYPVFVASAYAQGLQAAWENSPAVQQLRINGTAKYSFPKYRWTTFEQLFREWIEGILKESKQVEPCH
jgi:glycosyltransferase involved in cell wall biosynthesis